jgi:hypothetical protein
MEAELAVTVCREQAKDFIAIERIVTPKRSGALAGSEHVDSVTGGGAHAEAIAGPHIIYARFRNDGGTITRKLGRPHVLGSYGGPYFGKGNPATVKQSGAHYVEKAEADAAPLMGGVAEGVLGEFLDGL